MPLSMDFGFIHVLPVAVSVYEAPSGVLRDYNAQAAELWGRNPVPGDANERFSGAARMYSADGNPLNPEKGPVATAMRTGVGRRNLEIIIERPSGTRVPILMNLEVIRSPSGEVCGVVKAFQDISARKHAEQEMARHAAKRTATAMEQAQARILDSAHDAIFALTFDGTITFWNQGAERLYGWSKQEAMGQDVHQLLKTVFPIELHLIEQQVRENGFWRGQLVHTNREGRKITVASSWNLHTDADGNPTGSFEVNRDITAEKRAELALVHSEKLAAAGRLAATVAHEINNPLEAITNLVYLARQNPAMARHFLDRAQQELERVAQVVRQTLGFYRDSGQPVTIDVAETMTSVLELYERKLQAKSVQVRTCFAANDVKLTAFAGELRQVFSNLIANAADAVDENGQVAIRVRRWREWSHARREGVRITISDDGCGIPRAARPRVFEAFFTTKANIGTGLGLWVSKTLVEKQKGSVRMKSSVEGSRRGTTFSIFLPVPDSEQITVAGDSTGVEPVVLRS